MSSLHLADYYMRAHPNEAARVLEKQPIEECVAALKATDVGPSGRVLGRLLPSVATTCIKMMTQKEASDRIAVLPVSRAALLLRALPEETSQLLMKELSEVVQKKLRAILKYPDDTAGAIMDSTLFALPYDITVETAWELFQSFPHRAIYYVYVIDREQRLVGVMSLRDLALKPKSARLGDIVDSDPVTIPVGAKRSGVLNHVGWESFHALPVVDREGLLLGVVRYSQLRQLQRARGGAGADSGLSAVGSALGELYCLGLMGLMGAVFSPRNKQEKKS